MEECLGEFLWSKQREIVRSVVENKRIQIEMVYGTILIIGLIGIALYHLVVLAERRIVVWKR